MTTSSRVDERVQQVLELRALGRTYDQIVAEMNLTSRTQVHYYLHRAEAQAKNREYWRREQAKRKGEVRERLVPIGSGRDLTRFKPESKDQSRLWAKLLAEAVQ